MLKLERRLRDFSLAHRIPLSDDQIRTIVRLDALLTHWNRAVGLYAFRSEEERFARYFAEPLHASLWAPEEGDAWDLGTGGGTPALPLAIVRPRLRWSLVEPNRRKCVFLEEALRELDLHGCRVVRERLENLTPESPVSLLTSRGLAAARAHLARLGQWLSPQGRILLFTGQAKAQRFAIPPGLELIECVALAPDLRTRLLVIRPRPGPKVSGPAPKAARLGRAESGP